MELSVKNLTKYYGKQIAVNNVSFTLETGKVTGFIGPNGSGKSTTLKMITGILSPDSGEILFGNKPVSTTPEFKQKIGYLPEHNPVYLDMYIREYLEYVGKIYKVDNLKNRIEECISLVGLGKEAHKEISKLSKGYRQRVGIAQSLIHNPDILILDEPTTGLDPNQILEIRELISSISSSKTIVLTTHILQEVEAICDNIVLINNGRIIADDTTENVKNIQGTEQQIIVVETKAKVKEALLANIEGIASVRKTGNNIYELTGTSENDLRESIFNCAKENNFSILSLQKKSISLEDTFKQLSKS